MLKESDIIIFGHTNGKNVKPGQKALQADSEFKFVVSIFTFKRPNASSNAIGKTGELNVPFSREGKREIYLKPLKNIFTEGIYLQHSNNFKVIPIVGIGLLGG